MNSQIFNITLKNISKCAKISLYERRGDLSMTQKVDYDQISRIKIENYKSIKLCDLELNRLNILIGSNGSGKSNFISFFSLLQNILNTSLSVYVGQTGINSLFYNGMKVSNEISAEVYFGENSYGFILVPTDDNRLIFKREYFGYHGGWHSDKTVASGNAESAWRKGVGNLTDNYIIPILDKQKWKVYHFFDTSRTASVKREHNISNNAVLQYDASNLAAFLYRLKDHYRRNYNDIVQTIRLIAPYFDDFELKPNEGNKELIVLKWRQTGCDDIFNASQLSDGTLRFICLMTLLLQPKDLQPATIIIDEPELGLHPYAITVFSEVIRQASENKQIILSTQSVELLNEFDTEDIIVVNRSKDGTKFERLQSESLKEWLDNDYTLGELWNKNLLGGRLSK